MTPPPAPAPRFPALDLIRVVATVWVAWRHYFENAVVHMWGHGDPQAWLLANEQVVRWMLYSGELVLQLFMIVSAFGLTYQALGRESFSYGRWLLARARRIYPGLWVSILLVLATDLVAGWLQTGTPLGGMHRSAADVGWNALGFTCVRWSEQMSGAWWFIGLILSFYVCFPLFFWFARRGLSPVLVGLSVLVTMASREELGEPLRAVFGNPDSAFVGSRAMEFAFGVALAELCHRRRLLERPAPRFSWPVTLVLAALGFFALQHFALSRPLPPHGPAIAFLVFCGLLALFDRLPAALAGRLAALAGPSLLFYLLHHRLLGVYAPLFDGADPGWVIPVFVLFALVLGVICVRLQPVVERVGRLVFRR